MSKIPSAQQNTVYSTIINDTCNILIDAKAGSGKTTTLVGALKLVPSNKTKIFMAFNDHIVETLKEKLDNEIYASTFHALGWSSIRAKHKNAILDENKIYKIIYKKIRSWGLNSKTDQEEYVQNMKKMVDLVRLTLTPNDSKKVIELALKYDVEFNKDDVKRLFQVLELSLKDIETFDFTDMIYLPATDFRYFIMKYDYVFVDEAQDLSKAQQALLKRLKAADGRVIAVGDPNQTIMGFAGNDNFSFDNLSKMHNTKILPLSKSYRCAKNIIKHAQDIVPDIEYHDNAIDGEVRSGSVLDEAKDGDFVLCRTIKPLVNLFFELILSGKKATLKGKDYGVGLMRLVEPYKSLPISKFKAALLMHQNEYLTSLINKNVFNAQEHPAYVALKEKIEILTLLANQSQTVNDVIFQIEKVFTDDKNNNGILLMTVHKSKGLEADRVFIIRPDKLPLKTSQAWLRQQEKNLVYVARTRAKQSLIYDKEWTDE